MKHGSFFTGIGGFDLAAQWMDWENIFHCEVDEYKRAVLKKNFPGVTSYDDIKNFDGTKYKNKIDILSGGFPCQDISLANTSKKGVRGITGQRSGLWMEYARVIREIEPGIIVFENSPALLFRGFEHVLCDLSKIGYNVEWRCFTAEEFGYPHKRERLYGVAYSVCGRWNDIIENGGCLQKVYSKLSPRKSPILFPLKRFNGQSSYEDVRMDDGFSKELDKKIIHGFGNAIVPEIAYQIFKTIKLYSK
jgi:DNA (cytosine-5)-methyltransferase 1